MKNVLHLCESSDTGGAESVLTSLVGGLDKNQYQSVVCLLSEGWLSSELRKRNIETLVIPQPRSFDLAWMLRLHRLIRGRDIHVMHSHEFATNIYASMLSVISGVPVIATVHGKNYYGDKWRRRVAYRFVARQSLMVAVSNDLRSFLEKRVGIARGRIRVVHNGIDTSHFVRRQETRSGIAGLGIRNDQPVIGTVGNLFVVKGQIHLLRACQLVAKAIPDFVLLIAGEGDQRRMLETEAAALGITNNVKFLGFRADVPALLQGMDIFVLPSLSEGLPLSVLEALALQKAVVATDVGGVGEILENEINGFIVPPCDPEALANKILLLLRQPQLAAKIGLAGRRTVETAFGLEKMVREYQTLYEEVS